MEKITWEREPLSNPEPIRYVVIPSTDANQNVIFKGSINNIEIDGLKFLTPPKPIGIFEHHLDSGNSKPPGIAEYNPQNQEYRIIAGDTPMVISHYIIYRKVIGDFTIKARVQAQNLNTTHPLAGAGIGVIDFPITNPEGYCAKVNATTAKVTTLWSKGKRWGNSGKSLIPDIQDGRLEMERRGNQINTYLN